VPMPEQPTQRIIVDERALLKDLKRLFRECNAFAAKAPGGFRVWKSAEASENFSAALEKEVTDEAGFRVFVTDLIKGIWDGIDDSIFKAMQGKAVDEDKRDLAARLARVFVEPAFKDLKLLRNWANHDLSTGDKQEATEKLRRVGETLVRMVGCHAIKEEDAATWARLRLAVLRRLHEWFEVVLQAASEVPAGASRPAERGRERRGRQADRPAAARPAHASAQEPAKPLRLTSREEFNRELSDQAAELRQQRRKLMIRGAPAAEVEAVETQLLDLKRRLREGPRLTIGDCLSNRYALIEELGSGGFATVWKAFDEEAERLVALKVLHGQFCDHPERRERFHRGAKAMHGLNHPNITRVLEPYHEDGGYHYFTMEYLAGGTFFQAVTEKKLSPRQVGQVILEIGRALGFAHGHGVIHRDVTPDNILLDGAGSAKLTDFDLVRIPNSSGGTRTGALGKFVYAAPESLESARDVDQRCDIYSLGMTAIFGYHGQRLPHSAFTRKIPFIKHLDLPKGVKAVLAHAVRYDPATRYGSVEEFCAAFGEAFAKPAEPDGVVGPKAALPYSQGQAGPSSGSRNPAIPSLQVLEGPNKGAILPLDGEFFVLGRNALCDVVLPAAAVSREHARMLRIDGKFYIEDLKSLNGTFVNSQAIVHRTLLKNHDRIRICDFLADFRHSEHAQERSGTRPKRTRRDLLIEINIPSPKENRLNTWDDA
jgi:serine/threonine protein kinase